MQAKGQAIARGVDRGDDAVQLMGLEGGDMQHRAENFFRQVSDARNPEDGGGDEGALLPRARTSWFDRLTMRVDKLTMWFDRLTMRVSTAALRTWHA